MRTRLSAGLVLYRMGPQGLEVFLAHPGGPYFVRKDAGVWSIPKGEPDPGEDLLQAAIREVKEEVGIIISPEETFVSLGSIRQKGGKIVHAWAVHQPEAAPNWQRAQTFEMEWPPQSGRKMQCQEVDQALFFPIPEAVNRIKETQIPLLERLADHLGVRFP